MREAERAALPSRAGLVAEYVLDQRVDLAGLNIRFELGVGPGQIEFLKPGAELRALLGRERLDLPCDVVDVTHVNGRTGKV